MTLKMKPDTFIVLQSFPFNHHNFHSPCQTSFSLGEHFTFPVFQDFQDCLGLGPEKLCQLTGAFQDFSNCKVLFIS